MTIEKVMISEHTLQDTVDSISATNWSNYANQIKPISELEVTE